MPISPSAHVRSAVLAELSKQDIDRRLQLAFFELFTDGVNAKAEDPQWITAAEIVRRVYPMLSAN